MRYMRAITRYGMGYIVSGVSFPPASCLAVTNRPHRELGIMADSTPSSLTIIYGSTIRHGTDHASHVRSQLIRQRYREKRLRILRKNTCIDNIQINTQRHEVETKILSTGINLRQIAPCQIDPFLPDGRRTSHFDFLLHNCGFRDMVTIKGFLLTSILIKGLHVVLPTARPDGFAERILQAYLHPDRDPIVIQSLFYSATISIHALPILRGAQNSAFDSEPAGSAAISPTHHLQLKGSILNEIRQKLSTVDGNDLQNDQVDDIVLSILYLAANENLDQIRPPEKSPFSSPFRRLQSMELYGSCEFHPLHWQTVQHIILQRGGLSTINLYGLAWLISM